MIKNFIQKPPDLLKPVINASVNGIKRLAHYSIEKPSKFLQNTAAFAFVLGSTALIAALLTNKKVPEKERNYMIAQEGVGAFLHLGVFLAVASKFDKFGEKLVQKGMLIPSIDNLSKDQVKTNVKNFFKDPQQLSPNLQSKIKNHLNCTKVAASTLGILLAFNIASPIIRNNLASKLSNHFDKKKTANIPVEKHKITNLNSAVFNKFESKMNAYSSSRIYPSGSGMKI